MIKDFRKPIKYLKNKKWSVFYILQLPHTVISNSEKLTHPAVQPDSAVSSVNDTVEFLQMRIPL